MTKREKPHVRLTKTDFDRVVVAKKLRAFTRVALAKACGISNTAAKAWIYRHTGAPPRYRFFFPTKLADGRTLYQFTRLGCRIFSLPLHYSKRLGPQARIEKVAALDFIYESNAADRRYATPKVIQKNLNISDRHLARNFYFAGEGTERQLGIVFVGTGSAKDRIHSVLRFVEKALGYESLADLMRDPLRRLELAVLVRNSAQKKFIEKNLPAAILDEFKDAFVNARHENAAQLPFTILVEVLPSLSTLVADLESRRTQGRKQ